MLLSLVLATALSHADIHVLEEKTVDTISYADDGYPDVTARRHFRTTQEAAAYWRGLPQDMTPLARRTLENQNGLHLWDVRAEWSWEWEVKLAEWIRAEVDADYFVRHKVATDCADVAYALRWIFAREHGLPMRSRLGSGEWFTEASVRAKWEALPTAALWFEDRRFLAALDYVLNLTYTHTLRDDAYPVEITTDALLEGGFHLSLHGDSGHTQPIMHVARPGEVGIPLLILQSTVPRAVRKLMSNGYWMNQNEPKGAGGLLRFRWPAPNGEGLVPAESMPHFSEEQYDPAFRQEGEEFFLAVYRRIAPGFKLEELVRSMLESARTALVQRQQIVSDGFAACQVQDCAPGTPGFEAWSTPSRDARIGELLRDLQNLTWKLPAPLREEFEKTNAEPFLHEGGYGFSLRFVSWLWQRGLYDSDPRVSPDERWRARPSVLVAHLTGRVRDLWAEREAFLTDTSDCPATVCVEGSPAYSKRSSLVLDRKLLGLSSVARDYASLAPADAARDFARLGGQPLAPFGLDLRATLGRFLRLNSDPRHSAQVRRDGLNGAPLSSEGWGSAKSDQDFLVFFGAKQTVYDLRGPVPSIVAGEFADVDLRSGFGFLRDGRTLHRTRLADGRVTSAELEFEIKHVRGTLGGGAIVLGENRWAVLEADLVTVSSGPMLHAAWLDSDHVLIEDVGVAVVDRSGARKSVPLQSVSGLNLRATDLGWFVGDGTGVSLLRRADLTLRPLATEGSLVFSGSDGRSLFVQHPKGTARLELEADGAVKSRAELAGASNNYFAEAVLNYQDAGRKITCFARRGVECLAPGPGEDVIADVRDGYTVAKIGPEWIVRRGPSVVYRTKAFRVGLLPEGLAQVCEEVDWGDDAWQYACRVIDLQRPDRYSVLTGIAAIPFLRDDSWTLERGTSLITGMTTVWYDRLR